MKRLDLEEAAAHALSLARSLGAGEAEAYVERIRGVSVAINAGSIRSVEAYSDEGIGVRVVTGGRMGFAYTTSLTQEAVEEAVREAVEASRAVPPDPCAGLPGPRRGRIVEGLYSEKLAGVEAGEVVDLAVGLVAEAASKRLSTPYASADLSVSEVVIANTHGVYAYYKGSWAGVMAGLTPGGRVPPIHVYASSRENLPVVEGLIDEALEVSRLCRRVVVLDEPRRMSVVFSAATLTETLHATVLAAANAAMIARSRSPWTRRLGEAVISRELTIVDDPHIPGGDASTPFDGEGVATTRKPVVEKGVFRSIISDHYWGARLGTGSTGNAARGGYASTPHPAVFNVVVEPGDASMEEVLEGGEVLYVHDVRGAHTIKTETGEYSLLAAPGILYRGGEPIGMVKGALIAGVAYEDLKHVSMVSRRIFHPLPASYVPAIRIEGVMVSSQK